MRLNRVLLLAATVNIMIFALLFTISCSGDDGKNGINGKDCSVEANGQGGYDVFCGGDNLGILQGTADRDGKDGENGANGTDGTYCVVGTQLTSAGGLEIRCNGEVKGTLEACSIKDLSDVELEIACGKTTKINTCDGLLFDPSKRYCTPGKGLTLTPEQRLAAAKDNMGKCQGDSKEYNKTTHYCGYKDAKATKRTALPKCHWSLGLAVEGGTHDYEGVTNIPNKQPNEGTDVKNIYTTESECVAAGGDTIITYTYTAASSGYTTSSGSVAGTVPRLARTYSKCMLNVKIITLDKMKDLLGSTSITNNGTNCVAAGGDTIVGRTYGTTSNAICLAPFQDEYCQYVSPKTTVYPRVADTTCGGQKINAGKWNNEYCGYQDAGKVGLKVQTGLCDDYDDLRLTNPSMAKGPNEKAFGQGYCRVEATRTVKGVTLNNKIDQKTSYSEDLCGTSTKNKPNNGKWLKEYCGYTPPVLNADGTEKVAAIPHDKVYNDICDDDKGPQEDEYKRTNYCEVKFENRFSGKTTVQTSTCGTSGQPNKNTWQGQYCGFKNDKSSGADKVYSGICDDGTGPNENGYNKDEYCQAKKDGKTFLATSLSCDVPAKINEKEWKGEYCGYAEKEATETTVQTGGCGDEKGPNAESFGGGYCQAVNKDGDLEYTSVFCDGSPFNENEWKGEYCGYASATSAGPDKVYTGVCDNGGGPNEPGFNAGYCRWTYETSTGTEFADASTYCGGEKINEGSWKGEYCYADDKLAVCTGGRVPNTDKKSTDPFTVRCSFQNNDLVCSESNFNFCDKDGCDDLGASYAWNEESSECRAVAEAAD